MCETARSDSELLEAESLRVAHAADIEHSARAGSLKNSSPVKCWKLEVWVMDPTSAAAVQSQKRVSTRAASLTVDQCDLAIDLSELRQRVLEVTDLGDARSPDLAVSCCFVRIGGTDAANNHASRLKQIPKTKARFRAHARNLAISNSPLRAARRNMTFGEGHPRGTEADDVGGAGKRRVDVVGYVRHETRIEILGQPATSGDGTAEKVDASLRIAKGPITIAESNCHPVRAEADDVGGPVGYKEPVRAGYVCNGTRRCVLARPATSGGGTAEKGEAIRSRCKGPITIAEGSYHPARAEADDVGVPVAV